MSWANGIALGLSILFALGGPARGEVHRLPAVGGDQWRHLEIPKVEKKTSYRVVPPSDDDGATGGGTVRAESDCAASGLAVSLGSVDLDKAPLLRWDWRIEQGLDVADERSREGDDFAARVIVMFRYQPEQATFLERTQHAIAETLQGEVLPGRSLAYVWSSRQPAGTAWRNPFRSPTILISMGSGPTQPWRTESVDVRADYRRHWKADPPPVVGLAILTDADNTCSRAVAYYRNFLFAAPAAPPSDAAN